MTAEDESFRGFAWEGDPAVAGSIEVVFDGEVFEFLFEPLAGAEPVHGPRDALRAVVIGCEGAEFFKV